MSGNLTSVLIIEDDRSFGKALLETLKRSNYAPVLTASAADGLTHSKIQAFDFIVIDCMLPKQPGVELAIELIKQQTDNNNPSKIILISGIYRDKTFIKQAQQKTNAIGFLTKPFKPKELINLLEANMHKPTEDIPSSPISDLFTMEQITSRKILTAIDKSENIHSFELPLIYSLFLNAKLSGQMNITDAEGNIFGLQFFYGQIINVDSCDKTFNLIDMLFEKNYLLRNDFSTKELNKLSSNTKTKEFLQDCITNNLLSPHALKETSIEQLENRLNDTITHSSVEINFTKLDLPPEQEVESGFDLHEYTSQLNRWLKRKIPTSWLKIYYIPWLDHSIKHGANHKQELLGATLLAKHPHFLKDLLNENSIQKLIDTQKYSDKILYPAIHLLVITQSIAFGEPARTIDFPSHLKRLQQIHKDMSNKTYFEILNVNERSRISEIKSSFRDLSKLLHPDKLGLNAPAEVVAINDKVYKLISSAYNTLTDPKKRQEYIETLKQDNDTQNINSETLIESGKVQLSSGQAQKANTQFKKAKALNSKNEDLDLYLIWSDIKLITDTNKHTQLQQIGADLNEIPLKKRQSALYHFVKGLYVRTLGENDLAKKHLESCIKINSSFLEARRLLNLIEIESKQTQNIDLLHGDLKDVVDLLFKKK